MKQQGSLALHTINFEINYEVKHKVKLGSSHNITSSLWPCTCVFGYLSKPLSVYHKTALWLQIAQVKLIVGNVQSHSSHSVASWSSYLALDMFGKCYQYHGRSQGVH